MHFGLLSKHRSHDSEGEQHLLHSRRGLIFGVSLKTYKTVHETLDYVNRLGPVFEFCHKHGIQFFVVPDMVSLGRVPSPLPHGAILAAQDCYYEDHGAYTGTVSPANLAELGVKMVEVGHAEQRRLFGETDETVAKKSVAAARHGMAPLVCVGELKRCDTKEAAKHCIKQIEAVTDRLPADKPVVVAYEPVWAIGQPRPAESDYVIDVVKNIKHRFGDRIRVIYGGSAGPGLFRKLSGTLDGLFLGRFGHDVDKVLDVVKEAL